MRQRREYPLEFKREAVRQAKPVTLFFWTLQIHKSAGKGTIEKTTRLGYLMSEKLVGVHISMECISGDFKNSQL
jgi:hypothetical protein